MGQEETEGTAITSIVSASGIARQVENGDFFTKKQPVSINVNKRPSSTTNTAEIIKKVETGALFGKNGNENSSDVHVTSVHLASLDNNIDTGSIVTMENASEALPTTEETGTIDSKISLQDCKDETNVEKDEEAEEEEKTEAIVKMKEVSEAIPTTKKKGNN